MRSRTKSKTTAELPIKVIRFELSTHTMLLLVLVAIGLFLILKLLPVFMAIIVALFIVGTLNPLVEWLENKKASHAAALAIVFSGVFLLIIRVGALTTPAILAQISNLFEEAPALKVQLIEKLSEFPLGMPLAAWLKAFKLNVPSGTTGDTAYTFSKSVVEIIAYSISSVFLALYLMVDRERVHGSIFAIVPRHYHLRLARVVLKLETIVGQYIRGQIITSMLMSVFMFLLLTVCGVENALAIGVFAGLADVLPYVGALLTILPAMIAAVPHGPVISLIIFLSLIVYEELESRVLVPRIYGKVLRLPSSVVFLSLLIGGTLMGISGALLALPVAAALMMLLLELRIHLPGERDRAKDVAYRRKDARLEKEYERTTKRLSSDKSAAIAYRLSDPRNQIKTL